MIGQNLNNRYLITSRLGKGAMGTVYRATDKQSGREVALKVIASDLAVDPEMLERFNREGEALRKLKHPNIVEFMDAFQHDEQYVIVMEFIPGGSLHDLIKEGPMPIERARRIALELCDALIRSHHLNIIHRDLKPENVLIAEDGTPKLADFGVARLSEGTRMTRSGTQVGTPYYMAPEAWEGKDLDAQADIWSLGVLFFEMLTGQVPFGGDTGAAVMNKVLTTQIPDLRKLRADVPPNLIQIIKRMLTRDKKRRYSTMREAGVDLERGQQATTGIPAKTKPARWRPALIGLGIVLAISAVWLAKQSQHAQPAAQVTVPTNTPRPTATIIRTPAPAQTTSPTNTQNPIDQGLRVDACGNDLCVYPHTGGNTPLGLGNNYTSFFGASWSPEGSRIVFAACPIANLTNEKCQELFIVDQNGKNVIPLTNNPAGHSTFTPVWSPNGEWIAFQDDGTLAIIRPDGTGRKRVVPFITTLGIDPSIWLPIAWSPDSQQIAMLISVRHTDTLIMDPSDRVWIINRDGSGSVRTILKSDLPITRLAWSPDGQSVVVALEDGKAYRIDANCDSKPTGCDESSRTEINEIPQDWLPTFHPQWISAYVDPQAAVNGCGVSDKLLYANDFEGADTANQLGFGRVEEAPDGAVRALHMVNGADGAIDYYLVDSAVIETRISFRVMPINGAWGLRFRIGELGGETASHGLYVNPGDTPLSLNLDMDPSYAILGKGPQLLTREWSAIEMIREDSNTIVVWLNNEEVIRYVDSRNLLVPSGGINVNVVGKDAEAWYDDFVICGQEAATTPISVPPTATITKTPAPIPASLGDGLAAHYPFSGNANDVSEHEYHGVVNGATLSADRFGKSDEAYSFDGAGDFIEIPDIGSYEQLTESIWVYYKGTSSIAVLNNHKGVNTNYLHFELTDYKVEFSVIGNVDQYSNFAFSSSTLNQWHHLAVTYDSATLKVQFYIDGELDVVRQLDFSYPVAVGPAWIGGWDGASRWFSGYLDDIRFYDRVLSASEILALMNER